MVSTRWLSLSLLSAGLLLRAGPAAAQITPGQTDTFEDGTTQGWVINILHMSPPPVEPMNVATGGPAGAGDHYLLLTSVGGDGPASHLSVVNFGGQWAGDYLSSGITSIQLDANNFGSSDLFLRLLFEDPTPTSPPANEALSATAVHLAAGSGWTHLVLPLFGPTGLIADMGSVNAVLGAATVLRLYSSPDATLPPEPIVASLGVDNITAVVTPEPATVLLVATGLAALLLVGRRRSKLG